MYQLAGLLSKKRSASKRPTVDEFGEDIDTDDKEEQFWLRFMPDKFKAVDSERNREPLSQLPPRTSADDAPPTTKEKDKALGKMGANKACGPDDVPAEVYKNSVVAKEMLHEMADNIWTTEVVPDKLAVGDFCMPHKGKGKDPNDRKSCRALCMLNHSFKFVTGLVMERLAGEIGHNLPQWQAGFRKGTGTRDMVLVLRTLMNKLIELKNTAILNFLDFSAAFDSCSMKSLDESIQNLGGSRKMRALVRAICGAAKGRMRGGQVEFDVDRGVLQGDRLSPLLFIVCLAAVLKDRAGGGIEVGGIKLDMLGYADGICMLADDAEASSELANSVADKTGQKADMAVNIPKTETMLVHGNVYKESAVTKEEAADVIAGYEHACEFCPGKKFKTSRGLAMHQRKWCTQAAAVDNNAAVNVVEGYVINKMTEVRGPPDKRWYHVEWAGLNDSAEKLHGTDPGDAWPPNWEPAAHVEGATDINGNIATDLEEETIMDVQRILKEEFED